MTSDLNPVQQQAVSVVDGPVMIVAGAGSGKTRVLTFRVAHLIEQGIKPYQILALTFTNKAAKEMKSRIEKLVGDNAKDVWAGTFHSIFARILRHECEAIGFERNFTIYDSDDSLGLVKTVMSSLNISAQQFNPRGIQARISGAKNHLVSPSEYDNVAKDPLEQRTAAVYAEYQERLRRNNAMDFDDLLLKPIELFRKNESILEKYQYRFRYLLVDEYQDTNRAQYVLINLLASRFKNICVVGDDAQSIYAFRGADIKNILDFERDYPECKVFRLEQNYRSTKTILAAADSVIKNNKNQIHKTLWTSNAQGDVVTMIEAEDDKDEGMKIVSHIQEQCAKQKLDLKDFAILYRTNAQSRSLEDGLRRSGIPYVIVGGVEFYKRKEIKDVLAYLRVIVNPKDEESLMRILNFPSRGIGDTTIERLLLHGQQAGAPKTFFEVLKNINAISSIGERTRNAVAQFVQLIEKYIALTSQMSANEVARALVDELGILRALKEEATPEALGRWENIQELLSALSEFTSANPDASLENFLEEVSLVSPTDEVVDRRNAVTLMTLHSAKGLEFPVVFVAGLEEGLFPLYQVAPEPDELEEERRLFYVGITRAMKKLYLTHTRLRYRFGDVTYPVLSRFGEEIDASLIQHESSRHLHTAAAGHPQRTTFSGDGRSWKYGRGKENFAASHFDVDGSPDYENESQEVETLRVGSRVEHESFGRGKVLQLAGSGESSKAVVLFESVGPKNLMLKYANLRVL
ncbi:MAG TPA: UvrD-helicase domain-containing protein [Bacteroidota bacterium]|nr:UvrD-helicase domain-containing protein [Bacteroidota bacterium]